uniref:Aminopeptidase n=1 Tax=Hippocampus comes TaxID=109280 RepID=A0A3Q2Y010_HIPCM
MEKRRRVSKLCILCVLLTLASVATIVTLWTIALTRGDEGDDVAAPWDRYRLPTSLIPLSYNITLWPHLSPDPDSGLYLFTGTSIMAFECATETDLILIHSYRLNYTFSLLDVYFHAGDGFVPSITATWLQPKQQYLVVQLNGVLTQGETYLLYTEFTGELADDLAGLYRSEYEEDGVRRIVASSQMHPTHARKTFPCFDEPAMKAVFNMTLIHSPGTTALSNGDKTVNTTIDGIAVTRTTFEPTKKMSTYLLAIVISDYTHLTDTQGDILLRIWARKKALEQGQGSYARSVTRPVLEFLQFYSNISYPLRKLDQIALPDFYYGAMENWGLVTYRENKLLYSPLTSSSRNKQSTATIIAHELAHMWFGNLVTLRWWNEVWLNEGFASYVSYLAADYFQPTWGMKDQFVLQKTHRAFAVDALTSSHPLSSNEDSILLPEQISQQFDTISYSKGAAVLRMLSGFLSEPVFVQGLNVCSLVETLFYSFVFLSQQAVEANNLYLPHRVHDIMNRWVLQMGFPVVIIDTATGKVTQKHFLLDAESKPLLCGSVLLFRGINRIAIMLYMRTLKCLAQVIPLTNRAQLVDDAFNLARAQLVSASLALRTTSYLYAETEYIPWQTALNNFQYYSLMLDQTEVYHPMQEYMKKLVTPLYLYFKNMTSDWIQIPQRHTDQYNQVNAIQMACRTGITHCQKLTSTWFKQWMDNPHHNLIHPHLRDAVYCSAIASGNKEEWEFGWAQFKNTSVASEANQLMSALACTGNTQLLKRYLSYTLEPSMIRRQDAAFVIGAVASNSLGQELAWNFVRLQWDYMFTQYGMGSFNFASIIDEVTARFSTPAHLQQVCQC